MVGRTLSLSRASRHALSLARASRLRRTFSSERAPFAYAVINPLDPTMGRGGFLSVLREMNPLTVTPIGWLALVAVRTDGATSTNFDGIDDDHLFELTAHIMKQRGLMESDPDSKPSDVTLSREKLAVPGTVAAVEFHEVWRMEADRYGRPEWIGPMNARGVVEASHDDGTTDVAVRDADSAQFLDLSKDPPMPVPDYMRPALVDYGPARADAAGELLRDTQDERGRPGFVARVPNSRLLNQAVFFEMYLYEPLHSLRFKLAMVTPEPLRFDDILFRYANSGELLNAAQLRYETARAVVKGEIRVHLGDSLFDTAVPVHDPTVVVAPSSVMLASASGGVVFVLTFFGGIIACHPAFGAAHLAWPLPPLGVIGAFLSMCWPNMWRFMPPPIGPRRRKLKL